MFTMFMMLSTMKITVTFVVVVINGMMVGGRTTTTTMGNIHDDNITTTNLPYDNDDISHVNRSRAMAKVIADINSNKPHRSTYRRKIDFIEIVNDFCKQNTIGDSSSSMSHDSMLDGTLSSICRLVTLGNRRDDHDPVNQHRPSEPKNPDLSKRTHLIRIINFFANECFFTTVARALQTVSGIVEWSRDIDMCAFVETLQAGLPVIINPIVE